MFSRILVAFDGTERSRRALKTAAELASALGKPLRSITVVEDVPAYITGATYSSVDPATMETLIAQRDGYARELVDEVKRVAAEAGCDVVPVTAVGSIVDAVVEQIKANECDLLVIGLRSHPGLVDRLWPHTGQSIAERAPCSILAVR